MVSIRPIDEVTVSLGLYTALHLIYLSSKGRERLEKSHNKIECPEECRDFALDSSSNTEQVPQSVIADKFSLASTLDRRYLRYRSNYQQ